MTCVSHSDNHMPNLDPKPFIRTTAGLAVSSKSMFTTGRVHQQMSYCYYSSTGTVVS